MKKDGKLRRFQELLERENKRVNLVSKQMSREELEKHFEDCLEFARYWDATGKLVADIGSGGGLPGMVLAIVFSEGKFCLIEADSKKSAFLTMAGRELNLPNVSVITERVEAIGRDDGFRAMFDFVLVRAVARLNVLVEYGLPLLKRGGLLVAWKGRNCNVELKEAVRALEVIGGQVKDLKAYCLLGGQRYLVAIEKVKETPEAYPRRIGVPEKRPL